MFDGLMQKACNEVVSVISWKLLSEILSLQLSLPEMMVLPFFITAIVFV